MTAVAFFSSMRRQIDSAEFEGGSLAGVLGACQLDLKRASLAGNKALIDVMAFWGGVEIRVPDGWNVNLEVIPIMGGAEDKTRPSSTSLVDGAAQQHLTVKGFALMGGVEIRN